ncbi:hypothetical protein SAMN04488102_10730 [Alkalibacterium subtropicum]|uniref:Uncharacterized protein n=1 Tax=Alkalibacterium subtropicum TaxID=753702 RepID=A0A1I1J914_9LACT|nr:hypothetical protein [Alkalibacterium subtropicum]SFC44946.1 hypothetical protein SAMN04488102_10730 [Alkalibacterium subtropicum]
MSNKNSVRFGLNVALTVFLVSIIVQETALGSLPFLWRLPLIALMAFGLGFLLSKVIPIKSEEDLKEF